MPTPCQWKSVGIVICDCLANGLNGNIKNGSDGKRKSTYGFKTQLNVDEDSLIKPTDYSSDSSHDSNHFAELFANSAYQSEKHIQWLLERGIDNRLTK